MCGVEGMREITDYKITSSAHNSFTGDDVRIVKFPLSKNLMLSNKPYPNNTSPSCNLTYNTATSKSPTIMPPHPQS